MTVNVERHSRRKDAFYRAHQKNLNEDRPILSEAKCRSMILVSRNIGCKQIFAGVFKSIRFVRVPKKGRAE